MALPEANELRRRRPGSLIFAFVLAVVLLGLVPLAVAGIIDRRPTAEWFIAVRYLLAKRRQTFISIITGICVVGIAAGVWLIITVLSVMNGFERTWRDEIIGNRAHFTVQSGLGPFGDYETVLATVAAHRRRDRARPRTSTPRAWCAARRARSSRCGCAASIPARVAQVTDLRDDVIDGSLESLAPERVRPATRRRS